jgi:hypothetical protein
MDSKSFFSHGVIHIKHKSGSQLVSFWLLGENMRKAGLFDILSGTQVPGFAFHGNNTLEQR